MADALTKCNLLIVQARAFCAQHKADLRPFMSTQMPLRSHRRFADVTGWRPQVAGAGCQGKGQCGAGQRLFNSGSLAEPVQDVSGATGHGNGIGMVGDPSQWRGYQNQVMETHGLDGASCRADIARMAGTHHDKSNTGEGVWAFG